MAESIDDIILEFESKIKQVSPEDIQMAEGKTPAGVAEVTVETVEGEACVNKGFKELVGVLPEVYMGKGGIKDLLDEFLGVVPECEG